MRLNPLVYLPLLAALVVGCDKTPVATIETGPAGLFDQVPATTPYVFGNRKPYPRDAYLKQLELGAQLLPSYRRVLSQSFEAPDEELTAEQRQAMQDARAVVDALLAKLDGKMTPEGIESLGFRLDARWVVYGDALTPVFRQEIADGAKVLAFMREVEQQSGVGFPWAAHGDVEYLRFAAEPFELLVAVKPTQLIAALLPTDQFDARLSQLLSEEPAADPLTEDGLTQRLAGYDYPGYGDGYLDHAALYRLLTGQAGAMQPVNLGGGSQALPVSPACNAFVEKLVTTLPRTVAGTPELNTERMRVSMVLETSPAVAEALQGLTIAVPGVGRESDAMYTFGAAMKLTRLRISLKQAIRYLMTESGECEWVDQHALQAALPQLDTMLSPFTAMFKGLYVEAIDVETDPATGAATDVRFRGLVQLDDPRGLFAMLGMFAPGLAQLEVPQDGTPQRVPAQSLPPGAPELYVAANDQVLSVASGKDGAALVSELLAEAPVPGQPLLSFSYNFKRLSRFMTSGLDAVVAQAAPSVGGPDIEQVREDFRQISEMLGSYGTINTQVLATTRGLAFEQTINWD